MGALASVFGALSGLGDLGQQLGVARQQNREEAVRRLAMTQAYQQRQQQMSLQQQEFAQRLSADQQSQHLRQQEFDLKLLPQPDGNPYVSNGKTYQRYINPGKGNESIIKELPGGTPETPMEATARALRSLGATDEEIKAAELNKIKGRTPTHTTIEPDPNSFTRYSAVYKDYEGNELSRSPVLPQRGYQMRKTDSVTIDQFGNRIVHSSTSGPVGPELSGSAQGSQGGAVAPQSGGFTAPRVAGQTARGQVLPPAAAPVAPGQVLGTYKGLTPEGVIPMRPGLNTNIVAFANDILASKDTDKIPMRARGSAENLARAYGWRGQGSLSPKQQLQIKEGEASIDNLLQGNLLKVLDGPGSFLLAAVPGEVSQSSGVHNTAERLISKALYKRLSAEQNSFLQSVNQLRTLMGGLRQITGGNISEAQVQRMITELPDPATTPNSTEGMKKLRLLKREIDVAKAYGYFPLDIPGAQKAAVPEVSQTGAPTAGNHDFEVTAEDMAAH